MNALKGLAERATLRLETAANKDTTTPADVQAYLKKNGFNWSWEDTAWIFIGSGDDDHMLTITKREKDFVVGWETSDDEGAGPDEKSVKPDKLLDHVKKLLSTASGVVIGEAKDSGFDKAELLEAAKKAVIKDFPKLKNAKFSLKTTEYNPNQNWIWWLTITAATAEDAKSLQKYDIDPPRGKSRHFKIGKEKWLLGDGDDSGAVEVKGKTAKVWLRNFELNRGSEQASIKEISERAEARLETAKKGKTSKSLKQELREDLGTVFKNRVKEIADCLDSGADPSLLAGNLAKDLTDLVKLAQESANGGPEVAASSANFELVVRNPLTKTHDHVDSGTQKAMTAKAKKMEKTHPEFYRVLDGNGDVVYSTPAKRQSPPSE